MGERGRLTQLPGKHVALAEVRTIAGGTADEQVVFKNRFGATVKVTAVGFIPEDAITGAATNNFAVSLRNKAAGGAGTTAVSQVKTFASGTNAAAFVEDAQTLSATAANLLVASGEALAWHKTENGTGLAMPAGQVVIEYEFV